MDGNGDFNDGADELAWRETYFILFRQSERPTLAQVEDAISGAGRRLTLENLAADEEGFFQSVLVQAPEDNAAMEISYEAGDAVMMQSAELAKALQAQLEGGQLAQLLRADARLDVMHFERLAEGDPFEVPFGEDDEMLAETLDPASLISVVDALARLTGGLSIDPASGEVLE